MRASRSSGRRFALRRRTAWRSGLCERFGLDWLLILNQPHLERVLGEFLEHYNGHRPHRALTLMPPDGRRQGLPRTDGPFRIERRDRLGGVIHEYTRAAT